MMVRSPPKDTSDTSDRLRAPIMESLRELSQSRGRIPPRKQRLRLPNEASRSTSEATQVPPDVMSETQRLSRFDNYCRSSSMMLRSPSKEPRDGPAELFTVVTRSSGAQTRDKDRISPDVSRPIRDRDCRAPKPSKDSRSPTKLDERSDIWPCDLLTSDDDDETYEIDEDFSEFENEDVECSRRNAKIREAQLKEPGWRNIVHFLDGSHTKVSKRLRRTAKDFVLRQGLLYKVVPGEGSQRLALVVPLTMRAEVLHRAHDSRLAGHLGASRTFRRLRSQYFWKEMRKDCRSYAASCIVCGMFKARTSRPMGHLIPFAPTTVPFQKVAIDKFGSIQNDPDGRKYVFLAIDFCTRYVTVEATISPKAADASRFMEKIILQHHPEEVLSDNGGEFESVFAEMLESFGILHRHSSPRHPKGNGLVERANKTISQILRTILVEKDHSDWVSCLPFAVHAYNTSIHEVTRYSPHFLLYGYEPRRQSLMGERMTVPIPRSPKNVIEARQEAAKRTEAHRRKEKERYDRHRKPASFAVGDLVMVEVSLHKPGISIRFAQRRTGPFEVARIFPNNTIEIKGSSNTSMRVNVERCLRIQRRPEHLQFDDGLDDTIHSVARGPVIEKTGGGTSDANLADFWNQNPEVQRRTLDVRTNSADFWSRVEANRNVPMNERSSSMTEDADEDIQLQALTPLRRSGRKSVPPERLIEVMTLSTDNPAVDDPEDPLNPDAEQSK